MPNNNKNDHQEDKPSTTTHDSDMIYTLTHLKYKAFNFDTAFMQHSYCEASIGPYKSTRRVFEFDHIVIKTKTRSMYYHNDPFDDTKFIDISNVVDYPEECLVLIDASKGLNAEFFWYLNNRIDLLLALVNLNYNNYNEIEDYAAFGNLMTTIRFVNKYSDKFNIGTEAWKLILVRCYDIPDIYFKVIPTVTFNSQKAPKPTSILDNPRYNTFPVDPLKEIKDFDTATIYPTKLNPMNLNPEELMSKVTQYVNNDVNRFEKANIKSTKQAIEEKKTDVKKRKV